MSLGQTYVERLEAILDLHKAKTKGTWSVSRILFELLLQFLNCLMAMFLVVKVNDEVPPRKHLTSEPFQVQTHPLAAASQDYSCASARLDDPLCSRAADLIVYLQGRTGLLLRRRAAEDAGEN